ncbi:N-6 DNA methylase [Gallibacterium salpingitidis]|uniref:N-6 DNA methylase n=1 Tax=Gallibacterium salpingitidis TaxID=505341 RepID=UPI000836DA3C|nr:N-6 DNA methylase [Gallibacterium salpingitidis]
MENSLVISKQRVKDFGEVFTPQKIVKDMCDLVHEKCCDISAKFLEPTCGIGNFLIEILQRKLTEIIAEDTGHYDKHINFYLALASLYGIDIQADNIVVCRSRLKEIFTTYAKGCKDIIIIPNLINIILGSNIRQGNALTDNFVFLNLSHDWKNERFILNYFNVNLAKQQSQVFLTVTEKDGFY